MCATYQPCSARVYTPKAHLKTRGYKLRCWLLLCCDSAIVCSSNFRASVRFSEKLEGRNPNRLNEDKITPEKKGASKCHPRTRRPSFHFWLFLFAVSLYNPVFCLELFLIFQAAFTCWTRSNGSVSLSSNVHVGLMSIWVVHLVWNCVHLGWLSETWTSAWDIQLSDGSLTIWMIATMF